MRPEQRVKNLALKLNATMRYSLKGVPHIIISAIGSKFNYSICYFGKTSVWRIFYPYAVPNDGQQKWDFKTEDEVVHFFRSVSSQYNIC